MGRMTVQTVASSLDMCHSNEPVGENNNNESMSEKISTLEGLIRSITDISDSPARCTAPSQQYNCTT